MRPFPIEELVDRVGSRFTVVVAAAKRAKQLKDGAPPLVNLPTRNALTIALHEIAAGLIKIGDAPPEVLEDRPGDEPADLAAPEVVETLLERAATLDEGDIAEDIDDDYDSDLDEEIASDLDEDEELEDEDEEEEEELEETDLEAEDDWDEGEEEE